LGIVAISERKFFQPKFQLTKQNKQTNICFLFEL
jgi:hypothetical protein